MTTEELERIVTLAADIKIPVFHMYRQNGLIVDSNGKEISLAELAKHGDHIMIKHPRLEVVHEYAYGKANGNVRTVAPTGHKRYVL